MLRKETDEDLTRQEAAPCRKPRVAIGHPDQVRGLDLA